MPLAHARGILFAEEFRARGIIVCFPLFILRLASF